MMKQVQSQLAYTLIELMMVIVLSMLILGASLMYIQSVYRANVINEGEQLIMQVIAAAKGYFATQIPTPSTGSNRGDTIYRQYNGISTGWIVDTGQIPFQFIDGELITTPWGEQSFINVDGGDGKLGNRDDSYLYLQITHLPEYACMSLAQRLLSRLGTSRIQSGRAATYTACTQASGIDGPYVLEITTNPQLY